MILTTIQALIFITYIAFLYSQFGKPLPSISQSWYDLPRPMNNLFTLFCWSIGIAMIFQGGNAWFFMSGAGLCFVGAATTFLSKAANANIVHYLGAAVGIGCALFGLGFQYGIYFPLLVFILGTALIMIVPKINNKIWWVEILAFVVIVLGFYTR